jgi:hypothetical protein
MTKARIKEFLNRYADEVYDMPDHALELMMDNHKCVKWYGKEYFVSESISCGEDEEIYEHLVYNYGL